LKFEDSVTTIRQRTICKEEIQSPSRTAAATIPHRRSYSAALISRCPPKTLESICFFAGPPEEFALREGDRPGTLPDNAHFSFERSGPVVDASQRTATIRSSGFDSGLVIGRRMVHARNQRISIRRRNVCHRCGVTVDFHIAGSTAAAAERTECSHADQRIGVDDRSLSSHLLCTLACLQEGRIVSQGPEQLASFLAG